MKAFLTERLAGVNFMRMGSVYFIIGICVQFALVVLLFSSNQPVIVGGIIFTLLSGLLIFVEPRLIFILITFVTFSVPHDIIGSEFVIPLLGFNWYIMDWILFFSLLAWFTRVASGITLKMQKSPITVPMLIFFTALVISAGVGVYRGYPPQDVFADLRLFFYYFSFFIVLIFVRNFKDIEMIFWGMIVCGTIGSMPEILSSISQSQVDILTGRKMFFTRITGPQEVNYPIQLVASVVMFPFIKTIGKKIILVLSSLISTMALFLSYTRGSWLAAVIGLVLVVLLYGRYALFNRGNYLKISGLILFAIFTVFLLDITGIFTLDIFLSRISLVSVRQIDISSLERVTEWQVGWQVFVANPLLGAGLGFIYHFNAVGIGNLTQIFLHNSYLYVLSKMGMIGFISFVLVYMKVLISSVKSMRILRHSMEMGLLLAFSSMILVLLVKSLTTWHLNTLTTSQFVGLILGIVGVFPQLISAQLSQMEE
jgi:O-antigen ligase